MPPGGGDPDGEAEAGGELEDRCGGKQRGGPPPTASGEHGSGADPVVDAAEDQEAAHRQLAESNEEQARTGAQAPGSSAAPVKRSVAMAPL